MTLGFSKPPKCGDDRSRALRANRMLYAGVDEKSYIQGAPHLKHDELRNLLSRLTNEALGTGRTVLDVGGGAGLGSFPLTGRNLNITVVDSSGHMLGEYMRREPRIEAIEADVTDWLSKSERRFDLIVHVSMLHHIPDYLAVIEHSTRLVKTGGALMTFQDPLLYGEQPRIDRVAEMVSYFSWRIFQGSYGRGISTLSRRARGIKLHDAHSDFGEYHVVRDGVDSNAIVRQLLTSFGSVRKVSYWATQGRLQQWFGRRAGLTSYFGIVATGRR